MVLNSRSPLLVCVYLLVCLCGVTFSQTKPKLNLDKVVTRLYQYESGLTKLFKATCVTTPPEKTCKVSNRLIHPANPCRSCFVTLPNCEGKAADYCVWYLPDQGFLSPRLVPRYVITLEAEDSEGLATQRLVDIRIVTNSPPYFVHPSAATTVTIFESEKKKAGTILATVSALDDNNDTLTYTMTTVPDVGQNIVINSLSGEIRNTKDLKELCLTSVSCLVKVQDPYSKAVGPFVVNLDLKKGNHPPIITNLNAVLYLREDEPVGKIILDLTIFDEHKYPSVIYTFTTVPPSMQDFLFFKDTDDTLRVKKQLDYETHPKDITMHLQASDGYCKSERYELKIKLVDVNEPPILVAPDKIIETCEGQVDIIPVWNASDPDAGDSWTFTDVQPNKFGRFKIFEKSGRISTTIDYDLDVARLPSTVELIATLSDQQKLTATATVTVRFLDCNDNAPVFPKGAKEVKVTPCDPVGTVLGVVPKATDADSDFRQNNVITYSGSSGLVTVDKDGNIVLKGQFLQGQHHTFAVHATDKGEHPGPLTSKNPLWLSVYAEACSPSQLRTTAPKTVNPPTTTTAPPPTVPGPNASDDWDANEIWLIAVCLLSAALLILGIFMFIRYGWSRCRQTCRRGINGKGNKATTKGRLHPLGDGEGGEGKKAWSTEGSQESGMQTDPTKPLSPPPKKRGPGFIFGWWKETFADIDYGHTPNRQCKPEPSQKVDKELYTHTYDPGD